MKTLSIVTLGMLVTAPLVFLSGCAPEVGAESISGVATESDKTTTVTVWSNLDRGVKTGPANPMPSADNTAMNSALNTSDTKTAMDQSETTSAISITATIRRAVIADESLSLNAKNCKIITDERGVVTLRGVVKDQAERDSVGHKAKVVVGVTDVENQLTFNKPILP